MSMNDDLTEAKDFWLDVSKDLVSQNKISTLEAKELDRIVDEQSASFFASDSTDIITLCDSIRASLDASLDSLDPEVKTDLAFLCQTMAQGAGSSKDYGYFAAAKEQGAIVAESAADLATNVANDVSDMSIPYAVIGGALGFVAAPLLVATVPLATITAPIVGATLGYSSKKIQNFAASLQAKVKGWF